MPQITEESFREKKKQKRRSIEAPPWMVTYGDMTTLLLTFFIILLTTAKIDGYELKIVLSNFPGLDKLLTGVTLVDGPLTSQSVLLESSVSDVIDTSLNTVEDNLSGFFNEFDQSIVQLTSDERGLVVSLATDYFFERYSAKIDISRYGTLLRKVSQVLKSFVEEDGYFRVEGHSDEKIFPVGLEFNDVWELSSARAVSVIQLFEKFLIPLENAHVSGFGNTKPFVDQESDNIFNRRVDIILLNEGNL